MKEFMLIIRGGDDIAGLDSPEEMEEHMQKWQKWMSGLSNKNKLVGGQPLMIEGKSIIDAGSKVIDRPMAEGKELIGGYIIVNASDLGEAVELTKGCPGFDLNCTIEVREIRPM